MWVADLIGRLRDSMAPARLGAWEVVAQLCVAQPVTVWEEHFSESRRDTHSSPWGQTASSFCCGKEEVFGAGKEKRCCNSF